MAHADYFSPRQKSLLTLRPAMLVLLKNVAKNLTERQQQIIALITDKPHKTRAEIATTIGVTTKTVERELTALSDNVRVTSALRKADIGNW